MSALLHAATGGHEPGAGPTVVMIHGSGSNRTIWAAQARHLAARGFDVLALDLPGHGESRGDALDTVEGYAAAVLADLGARAITKFALVGHSMGSLIALEMAARAPDEVSALVLLGAGPRLTVNEDLLTATRDDPETAVDAIVDWGHSASTHIGGGQTPGLWMDGVDTAVLRHELVQNPGSLHTDFLATSVYEGTEAATKAVAPTLILAGSRDLMTPPRLARELSDLMADSTVVELQGCGHFMTTERPTEICRALARFLNEH